jgi:hypothetical protein
VRHDSLMSDLDRKIVACVDRFRQDLATMVVQTVGELVESVREQQALKKKAVEQRVLQRLERAAERRAKAAAARAESASTESEDGVEFKFKRRRGKLRAELASVNGGTTSRRGRRGASDLIADGASNGDEHTLADGAAAGATPEAKPAPLFVHKRTRDGQIQSLSRSAEEEAANARVSQLG